MNCNADCLGRGVYALLRPYAVDASKPNVPLPNDLDAGSGSWKIVYVALEVQTYADMNNGIYTYQYRTRMGDSPSLGSMAGRRGRRGPTPRMTFAERFRR
jgi:hypothetical protein